MGKISPVSAKYIIHAFIQIEGVVERPDVIGAVFGQTEGLLGSELELRELQRSGRIGRIEVDLEVKTGKSQGYIIIPSSLDKAETAIVGAALETIQRIGPCNAKVKVEKIEDVRINKRGYVLDRAKELLKSLNQDVLPDSQEITDQVSSSVMMMNIVEYGADRLPSGPDVDKNEEVILVEGRADVLNLLRSGFNNVVAINGTSIPETVKKLCKEKTVTVFVDGDRGGSLIIRELSGVAEVDFVAKAPDGKEVEELTKKEIHQSLRAKIPFEQFKKEGAVESVPAKQAVVQRPIQRTQQRYQQRPMKRQYNNRGNGRFQRDYNRVQRPRGRFVDPKEKQIFKQMNEELIGTHGACILDQECNVLGKVPVPELATTLKSLKSGVYAVVLDGIVTLELARTAERIRVKYLVANSSKVKPNETRVNILLSSGL